MPEKASTKAVLEENQKDIKKNVEKLFDLASQLKEQVEKTDSTTTLSLALVKKAEEIEKLKKDLRTKDELLDRYTEKVAQWEKQFSQLKAAPTTKSSD